jgi:hypothetical protein
MIDLAEMADLAETTDLAEMIVEKEVGKEVVEEKEEALHHYVEDKQLFFYYYYFCVNIYLKSLNTCKIAYQLDFLIVRLN